jgi:hypothetical protein
VGSAADLKDNTTIPASSSVLLPVDSWIVELKLNKTSIQKKLLAVDEEPTPHISG